MVPSAELAETLEQSGRAVCLALPGTVVPAPHDGLEMPADPDAYAAQLYDALRRADAMGAERIVIEQPPGREGVWLAVWDRLLRATGG